MILGYSWLREHNPEVDWSTGEVKMSQCPGRCSTCRTEIKQERHKRQAEVRHLRSCRTGSMPTVEEIFEDPPEFRSDYSETDSETEFKTEEPQDNPDEIEPGDCVFMTMVHDPSRVYPSHCHHLTTPCGGIYPELRTSEVVP